MSEVPVYAIITRCHSMEYEGFESPNLGWGVTKFETHEALKLVA